MPSSNTYIVPQRDLARLPAGPSVSDAPGVRLAVPNSDDGGEQVRQTTQLDPRESKEPPKAASEATGPNALKEASSAPTSIPQFAIAKSRPRIAAGLKPFADGWQWLGSNGYRAVLHLKAPGADDRADRDAAEAKRGLKFVSLEVSPENLSADLIDQFNKLLSDPTNLPLFIYDEDGALAGGMFYLHFLRALKMPETQAHQEANRLGLKDNATGDQGVMWLAIQKYLESQKK
ncbi:MAG: fused DSP-PTPase phosphatase/NAD kinase-like protein [Gemmataceae bacterium]